MAGDASRINGRLGGKPKGSKHWKTIKREEARAYYESQVAKHLQELTHIHLESAKDPNNKEERKYAFDQLIGKAKETVDVNIDGNLKVDV